MRECLSRYRRPHERHSSCVTPLMLGFCLTSTEPLYLLAPSPYVKTTVKLEEHIHSTKRKTTITQVSHKPRRHQRMTSHHADGCIETLHQNAVSKMEANSPRVFGNAGRTWMRGGVWSLDEDVRGVHMFKINNASRISGVIDKQWYHHII
ncbi:hypothetical protein Q8A67_025502 [Cirrhinus molitorella]|uniref:Uncharacterized protein n=1 Tax=Cirrhinus molitorella TaxID=172907 RepID=A0AA88NXR0_9TELE|nr:hypothetical protein Q8A67_025502 [Cirrhinus molitorella]